jgi:hypothetical protein
MIMKRACLILFLLLIASVVALAQSRRRERQEIRLKQFSSGRIIIHYVPSAYLSENITQLAKRLEENLSNAESTLGTRLKNHLTIFLFENWEEKGNYIDDVRLAHAEADSAKLYCIMNPKWDGIAERMEFQVLLRQAHGDAFLAPWAEYVSSALAGTWFQKSLDEWQSFLKTRELLPEFPNLFQDHQTSRFIRYPWNASLARFVKKEYGLPTMIQFYKSGTLPNDYRQRWQKNLAQIPTAEHKPYIFKPEFQRGISYAYWNSYDAGYATKKSKQSLTELRELGVEWIASIPYGFMRDNDSPEIRFPRHHIAGENDESLWALAEQAKERRMRIMLKPQIWISHSSWPGNISFESPEEWNLWLNNYEKWILHYAIIAELTDAPLFCIGTELVQATLNNPDRWRSLIKKIRAVYHGPLTYAANWGREFEGIEFWDALDYIGLDNYYPVRASEDEGIEEMKKGFAAQKIKLQDYSFRFCRPILFTEIGYMANNKAGMGPKEYEADRSDYDELLQAACYRLALETYWAEDWFAGMYWWKWFSEPADRGRNADDHSPHGRPAERVLAEWYRKKKP